MLKIVVNPNKILRERSKAVNLKDISSKKLNELFLDMEKIMLEKNGVGLAAPQAGKNIRICIISIKNGEIIKMINPAIIKKSWAKEWGEEGCLSVPGVFGKVKRHKRITCRFYDEKKKIIKLNAEDLAARVIQHEIDHLDGVLFIDKAKDLIKAEAKENV